MAQRLGHWTGNPGVVSSSLGGGGSFSEEGCLFEKEGGNEIGWSEIVSEGIFFFNSNKFKLFT